MTHPFDRCSFYVFPFAPPFFPLSQFPQRQLVIVENRCEILLSTKSSLLRSFSGFFFFVQLKIKNFILESWNFASFYKSFIPISFLLLFFNFKFLTFLPFDGDGGRIELECFEKFKFSVSLFVWSPFIETSPSWLAPPRSLKCSSRNQLPSTVRILLIMPLLTLLFTPSLNVPITCLWKTSPRFLLSLIDIHYRRNDRSTDCKLRLLSQRKRERERGKKEVDHDRGLIR